MSKSYTDGYTASIQDIEDFINHSIQQHGGCITPTQAVNVLNDTIRHLHCMYQATRPAAEFEEEVKAVIDDKEIQAVLSDINRNLKEIFGQTRPFTIQIIQGGKH